MNTIETVCPLPMSDPSPFIERAYRQSKAWQWLREAIKNAEEANANRIEVSVEPEGINNGVYRYAIYDDGIGIAAHEFYKFILEYGGGGKPVGEAWENFGIGFKSCSLPWNKYGLVVISVKDGAASMVWMQGEPHNKDGRTQTRYGTRMWNVEGEGVLRVISPFETAGIDFEKTIPDWIGVKNADGVWLAPDGKPAHGTVLIMMGNKKDEDTIFGDRSRNEALSTKTGERTYWPDHMYIENRFWEPQGNITVKMPTNVHKADWPKNRKEWEASMVGEKKLTQRRTCRGAKDWISHPYGVDVTKHLPPGTPPVVQGMVQVTGPLPAKIHWFLRDEAFPPHWHEGKSLGYIAALYDNEVYDRVESKEAGIAIRYNRFGVLHPAVQRRLFLVVEAQPLSEKSRIGVYPIDSNTRLICNTADGTAIDLPWEEWAEEFRNKLPKEIEEAEKKMDRGVTIDDVRLSEECRKRVAQYGDRFVVLRPAITPGGGDILNLGYDTGVTTIHKPPTDPPTNQPLDKPKPKKPQLPRPPSPPYIPAVKDAGDKTGIMKPVKGNIPLPKWVGKDEIGDPWAFARWEPGKNVVLLNQDHKILDETIIHACDTYHCSREDAVRAIKLAFGSSIIAKVAHTNGLKSMFVSGSSEDGTIKDTADIMKAALCPEALTMALLGFHDVENELKITLGRYGKR